MSKKSTIEYIQKIVPDAYHGTTLISAGKIFKEGFNPSTGPRHWLGDGVYFHESSSYFAEREGRRAARERGLADPQIGVICATINLGRCLNLNTYEHAEAVKVAKENLIARGKKDVTDAVAINFVALLEGADVVKCSFVWKKDLKVGERLFLYNPVLICVRNTQNILSMHLHYKGY
ncbi:hypothetical protein SAMN05660860_00121 [Geoalkalibacter ferrihydriticus]|uniref:Uncharacterized protein n=2 Tax=Geoalkalibacter ferrihydriticus TaxID=392333 RepID=A0A0C2HH17_9BACT|nr:hypothetical protein [Geoalkalibacter ferrihydriticus]KIH76261.1 hypothetical protein GFER_11630 [Geoalkalibacter ferrihydriticus DSM 17813]SDL23955.1 hypothetical protein SAMN05660860_00121 [Geoalkalibacter ferrihydriticus]